MTTRILQLQPSRTRPGTEGLRRRSWGDVLRGFGAGLVALDRIHRERRQMAELDERALRDIGITRAEVDAELRRPVDWLRLLRG